MAEIKHLVNINLLQNELILPVIHNLSPYSGPAPKEGQLYMDTGSAHTLYGYNGSAWIDLMQQGVLDGDYGDITVTGSGATWTIDPNAVTYAKIQDMTTARMLGRVTAGSGDIEELTAAQIRTLLNISDGAAANQSLAWVQATHKLTLTGVSDTIISLAGTGATDYGVASFTSADFAIASGQVSIKADGVSYGQIQNVVGNNVILGNNSGAGSIVDELTGTEVTAMLNTFTTVLKGLVPAPATVAGLFLQDDGTWGTPAGGFANFSVGGDIGSNQVINTGDILDIVGSTGITSTVTKATNIVTNSLRLNDTAVTPNTYGSATQVGQFTVDQQGRLTAASPVTIGITESQITNLGATITLNTDTTVSGYAWVIDEDDMVSDDDTKVPTQQSVKAYVDDAIIGGMTYKGGFDPTFNAGQGSPDIKAITSVTGDAYTVTADGTYNWTTGSAALTIGDFLIAEEDGILTNVNQWTILETNIDPVADATTNVKGIVEVATQTEVNTGTAPTGGTGANIVLNPKLLEDKLMGTYTGTTIPDNVKLKPALQSLETAIEAIESGIGTPGTQNSLTQRKTFPCLAAVSTPCAHSFGNRFVQVQCYRTLTPYDLVGVEVKLTSATTCDVNFNVAPTAGEYTIIVIG